MIDLWMTLELSNQALWNNEKNNKKETKKKKKSFSLVALKNGWDKSR